jgi:hypothetical protein
VQKLRERLLRSNAGLNRTPYPRKVVGAIHAWNYFVKSEPVVQFKIPEGARFNGLNYRLLGLMAQTPEERRRSHPT